MCDSVEASMRLGVCLFPPFIYMADNDNSSTVMVALIAILVIIAIGFLAMRVLPGMTDDGTTDINVEVPTPDVNPDGQ